MASVQPFPASAYYRCGYGSLRNRLPWTNLPASGVNSFLLVHEPSLKLDLLTVSIPSQVYTSLLYLKETCSQVGNNECRSLLMHIKMNFGTLSTLVGKKTAPPISKLSLCI